MKKKWSVAALVGIALIITVITACSPRDPELSEDEIEQLSGINADELISKTTSKPWNGEKWVTGKVGGVWHSTMSGDPRSFNLIIAETDAETAAVVRMMHDYLLDYDTVAKEFKPSCASAEVLVDENAGTLTVIYTLRDNLYWSFYNSDRKVKVTSDDVVFWYDEIEGDPDFHSSGYNGQFITMPDGTEAHVDIEKLDDRRFAFHFPRMNAEPLLHTNMEFGPRFLYEPAKRAGGVAGVQSILSVADDPKQIPSMGRWFLIEYTPGQRLVYARNPDYWDRDDNGVASNYLEQEIVTIISDENTQYLQFRQGKLDSAGFRPEELVDAVEHAGTGDSDYTVFNNAGSLSAGFWSFNQNPANKDKPFYDWFTKKEFRQAMSCLLNRERIINQVYRGLAFPKYDFFPEPNPYHNAAISLKYRYDLKQAESLLRSAGFTKDSDGILRDAQGREVEFDLSISADNQITSDIASIIVDGCKEAGIKVTIRQVDFQTLVGQLTGSYDWQTVIIAFGAALFPTQGSNVWPSTGNLHLWYPLQETPATDWEARVDYLYNEGLVTIDRDKARTIWNEYQEILLEQCPVVYLVRPRNFVGLYNKWDFSNVYYDNKAGFQVEKVWLK